MSVNKAINVYTYFLGLSVFFLKIVDIIVVVKFNNAPFCLVVLHCLELFIT